MVELPEIEKMINELDPTSLVHSLIDLANQNGGTDNSTAVCLKIS
jgi:serine/threonine protein phosphatase PrpC